MLFGWCEVWGYLVFSAVFRAGTGTLQYTLRTLEDRFNRENGFRSFRTLLPKFSLHDERTYEMLLAGYLSSAMQEQGVFFSAENSQKLLYLLFCELQYQFLFKGMHAGKQLLQIHT